MAEPGFKPRLSSSSVHNTTSRNGVLFPHASLKPALVPIPLTLRPALLAVVFPRPVALPDSPLQGRAHQLHLLQSPGKRPIGLPRHLPGISCSMLRHCRGQPACLYIASSRNPAPITLQRLTSVSCYPQQVCPAPDRNWFSCTLRYLSASPRTVTEPLAESASPLQIPNL